MFAFDAPRRPRRPSLTPMIDVVFLLLVFFMLAARFGPQSGLELTAATGGAAAWQGPPRLVEVAPGALRLNGVAMALPALGAELSRLSETPADPVLIRPRDGADLQALVDAMEALTALGFTGLMLVE
ncbi:ExbD/TolR family protein [Rhodovulum euryhalinum]|jgi:biopolymer transport protein ExbD|uniref:Biopolymer transport protein ExbD n=1 Tax=Rhodovulum euryhalinum TaxID=35805 RepID=A0A4R2KAM9_9RHOB|nr:biopolymer transporter ExbD [Rhodovulum euryhalinum]TCO70503.1 biopolymer transport protein ExbD [Rhodovulum euryhalinum]